MCVVCVCGGGYDACSLKFFNEWKGEEIKGIYELEICVQLKATKMDDRINSKDI